MATIELFFFLPCYHLTSDLVINENKDWQKAGMCSQTL